MTPEIAIVLLVAAGGLALFVTEKLPVDVTALLIMVVLMGLHLAGSIPFVQGLGLDLQSAFPTVDEGLSGLSNPATITVLAMFILSAGVQRTGLIDRLGRRLFSAVGKSETRQLGAVTAIVGPISGVINNTAAVAIMLPVVFDLARRTGTAASKLLIPLSFAAMLGGTLTLIGTSTNLLGAAILKDLGGPTIGMFTFTVVGLGVFLVGTAYLFTIGRMLIPERRAPKEEDEQFFFVEVRIPGESKLIGDTLESSGFETAMGVEARGLIRSARRIDRVHEAVIEADDVFTLLCEEESVVSLLGDDRVRVVLQDRLYTDEQDEELAVARVALTSRLLFHRKHVAEVPFTSRFGASLVGVHESTGVARRLGNLVLRSGQLALLAGPPRAIERLARRRELILLESMQDAFRREHTWLAVAIVLAVVGLAAFTPVPIVLAAIGGVVAMMITGVLDPDDAYRSVSWDVIFLLAGVIPLGIAMTKSGAADFLAAGLAGPASALPPFWIVFTLYLVTTLLTEIVSNNASVAILVPVAVSVASIAGLEPLPLALAVMFAASTSFMTPVGYQTNTMVYGTGIYRFSDFFRVGAPLNVLMAFTTSALLVWRFPV